MLAKDLTNEEWSYAKSRLTSRYNEEEAYLYLYGDEPLPNWLEVEITENWKKR